mgnify:CR=1 FL=1
MGHAAWLGYDYMYDIEQNRIDGHLINQPSAVDRLFRRESCDMTHVVTSKQKKALQAAISSLLTYSFPGWASIIPRYSFSSFWVVTAQLYRNRPPPPYMCASRKAGWGARSVTRCNLRPCFTM